MANGSLVIYDTKSSDTGPYQCVASNDAGTSVGVAMLTIREGPDIIIEPTDKTTEQGSTAMFNCVAEGEPKPTMEWRKVNTPIHTEGRVTILPNNSLRIIAAQPSDQGLYRCIAGNTLGRVLIEATLSVIVHGDWYEWSTWSECTTTCGDGTSERIRSCDNPSPQNGGRPCVGAYTDIKSCDLPHCPVNGSWGNWSPWEGCNVTCGSGLRSRLRRCDNPAPNYGGEACVGDSTDTMSCGMAPCPVDGGWGEWTNWTQCTANCGVGVRERQRACDTPRPTHGGQGCMGDGLQQEPCTVSQCAVDGSWSDWGPWSSCSISCGGGTMNRQRDCNNPPPAHGGNFCPGTSNQTDFCYNQPCPVNGGWSSWNEWGVCTVTCNGGKNKRFRTCSHPPPTHGGQACVGSGEELGSCNTHACPVNGVWSSWGEWSACSKTCGQGTRERKRICINSQTFGGQDCVGQSIQLSQCQLDKCTGFPSSASANIIGNVNDLEFGISKLEVIKIEGQGYNTINATIHDVPITVGAYLTPLISILTPIYWTMAQEVDGASNGLTLTQGKFRRDTHVEFATGEIIKMTHIARGVDSSGKLHLDIVVRGTTPPIPQPSNIVLTPYTEDYIQTGLGSIYAQSSRMFILNGQMQPYAWNHTIQYSPDLPLMPYLVEQLDTEELISYYDHVNNKLQFSLHASIRPAEEKNVCPVGFSLESVGPFCVDNDECMMIDPCSHTCHNTPGSFSCVCPRGFILESDGRTCLDIDECYNEPCGHTERCINTPGSFTCLVSCDLGYQFSTDQLSCVDTNECEGDPCDHICSNTRGSFICSCREGYKLSQESKCIDIDECASSQSPCAHTCTNTPGSYVCSCPTGYQLSSTQQCIDIDECSRGRHKCFYNQWCINQPGSYDCVCRSKGLRSIGPGKPCVDINECKDLPNICQFQCRNTYGSFECICPPNYRRLRDRKSCVGLEFLGNTIINPLQPQTCTGSDCKTENVTNICLPGYRYSDVTSTCVDINECSETNKCQHKCVNTPGSYDCTCPTGYRIARNNHTCRDINECKRDKIECGSEKMCFNHRGSFECIDIPCPAQYTRDPLTKYCVLECGLPDSPPCSPGSRYADVLQFRTLSLRSGIPSLRGLLRLTAYNQYDQYLPQTSFKIIQNDPNVNFAIRVHKGKGVVFATQDLNEPDRYVIKVRAKSFTAQKVVYRQTFLIHISVAAYSY